MTHVRQLGSPDQQRPQEGTPCIPLQATVPPQRAFPLPKKQNQKTLKQQHPRRGPFSWVEYFSVSKRLLVGFKIWSLTFCFVEGFTGPLSLRGSRKVIHGGSVQLEEKWGGSDTLIHLFFENSFALSSTLPLSTCEHLLCIQQ